MRKYVISIIFLFIIVLCLFIYNYHFIKKDISKEKYKYISLMNFDDYKNIDIESVESIEIKKYQKDKFHSSRIKNYDKIRYIYDKLGNKMVGKEVYDTCNKKSTFYVFYMKGDYSFTIEIGCGLLIINDKNYKLK